MPAILDNPVWHALTGPSLALGRREGLAARFDPEVAPFSALGDDPPPSAWDDLAGLARWANLPWALLFRPTEELPPGWTVMQRIEALQMMGDAALGADPGTGSVVPMVELGPADVPEMLDLVEATRPGPFARRTVELGGYLGVREGGRLVAMAGERLHCDGHSEVSAVCTSADHRGRGLARALVRAVVGRIRARGEVPFLHVETKNTEAIALYLALGFTVRREIEGVALSVPDRS